MFNKLRIGILILVLLFLFPVASYCQVKIPTPDRVLSTLDKSHPRLILKNEGLAKLKELLKEDKLLQKCRDDVLKKADSYLDRPVLIYKKKGIRLLSASRACVDRAYTLGLAWRLTGKEAYAKKLTENLIAVCDFKDWSPGHFLDTAEMTHGVAIGYDWLFDYFDDQTRQKIRKGLIEKGVKVGRDAYRYKKPPGKTNEPEASRRPPNWWATAEMNWNQVCNSGLLIGALAVAETDPEYAKEMIPIAVKNLPIAMKEYGPDGAWKEGPGYWGYATRYTVYGLAALDSALGTDFGLSQIEGFSKAGFFPIYTTGPNGLLFNYADAGERSKLKNIPSLFWLAKKFNEPLLAQTERDIISSRPAMAQDMIWYTRPDDVEAKPLGLDKLFRGPVEVAVFRSSWDDPNAIFVAVKAGFNQVNHAHLDLGSFEMDALGVRWARDLGSDNYDLPGYWERYTQTGRRWTYYRLGSLSHNVPLINNENQNVLAETKLVTFKSNDSNSFAILDLTGAYEKYAKKVLRGISLIQNRSSVLVQDEFELKVNCEVAWGMTTDAEISIENNRAVLSQDGKKLLARVLSPLGAEFIVESAEQKPPEKTNKGVKRLMVRLKNQHGNVRIAVLLQPITSDKVAPPPKIVPLIR